MYYCIQNMQMFFYKKMMLSRICLYSPPFRLLFFIKIKTKEGKGCFSFLCFAFINIAILVFFALFIFTTI